MLTLRLSCSPEIEKKSPWPDGINGIDEVGGIDSGIGEGWNTLVWHSKYYSTLIIKLQLLRCLKKWEKYQGTLFLKFKIEYRFPRQEYVNDATL